MVHTVWVRFPVVGNALGACFFFFFALTTVTKCFDGMKITFMQMFLDGFGASRTDVCRELVLGETAN